MTNELFQDPQQPQSPSDFGCCGDKHRNIYGHDDDDDDDDKVITSTHAIAVVAKCPIPGASKTRLIPLLGEEGSSRMAKAMLSDVLVSLSKCTALNTNRNQGNGRIRKFLYYAPPNDDGRKIMRDLLDELQLDQPDVRITNINSNNSNNNRNILNNSGNSLGSSSDYDEKEGWILCPMIPSDPNATCLGQILTDILVRTRQQISDRKLSQQKGNVVFLGMDCPELPLEEIVASLVAGNVAFNRCKKENDSNVESATQPELASRNSRMKEKNVKAPLATPISSSSTAAAATLSSAVICPANDGGYGMLSVPPQAPVDTVFKGIRWSNRLTALGQIKALTDCSIPVRLGRMMNDIDEPDDVHGLCQRLSKKLMEESSRNCEVTKNGALVTNKTERKYDGDILSRSSKFSGAAQTGDCHYTAIALKELNLL